MKDYFKYILLVVLFIVFVISFTMYNLYIKKSISGNFNVSSNYNEIKYTNIVINDKDNVVKIDDKNKSIHIEIPKLVKDTFFSVDIVNIGNKDIIIKNFSYMNIDTDLDKNNIVIDTSLKENEIIKGGYSKKLNIYVRNNNKNSDKYNFNINLLYDEI